MNAPHNFRILLFLQHFLQTFVRPNNILVENIAVWMHLSKVCDSCKVFRIFPYRVRKEKTHVSYSQNERHIDAAYLILLQSKTFFSIFFQQTLILHRYNCTDYCEEFLTKRNYSDKSVG